MGHMLDDRRESRTLRTHVCRAVRSRASIEHGRKGTRATHPQTDVPICRVPKMTWFHAFYTGTPESLRSKRVDAERRDFFL